MKGSSIMLGIASNQPRQIPYGACDGGGLTARTNPPRYACDGGGLTSKTPSVEDLQNATTSFVGKAAGSIKDYVRKPAKNDASQVTTPAMDAEAKKTSKKGNFIAAAILLIGGAALGYGHRHHIEKCFDNAGKTIAKWAENPTCQKLIQGGKDLLAKAKDAIFVKA